MGTRAHPTRRESACAREKTIPRIEVENSSISRYGGHEAPAPADARRTDGRGATDIPGAEPAQRTMRGQSRNTHVGL